MAVVTARTMAWLEKERGALERSSAEAIDRKKRLEADIQQIDQQLASNAASIDDLDLILRTVPRERGAQ